MCIRWVEEAKTSVQNFLKYRDFYCEKDFFFFGSHLSVHDNSHYQVKQNNLIYTMLKLVP